MWYKETFTDSAVLLYGGTLLVALFTFLYINGKTLSIFSFPKGIQYAIVYGGFSLISGIFIANDVKLLLTSLVTYFAFLFVCCCICVICAGENSIDWLIKMIIFICFLCAIYTIFNGYDYYNGIIVKTMGPENNPNTLGTLMVFGIALMMLKNKQKMFDLIKLLLMMVLFIYVIILTGSKKALLSAAILVFVWLFVYLKDLHKNGRLMHKFMAYAIMGIMIYAGSLYFKKTYINTASFVRMQGLFTSGSTQIREGMYVEAIDFFCKSPIIGIGYNQFRVLSNWRTYAHSTYAEVLADGGILGSIIYFFPLVRVGSLLLKKFWNTKIYEIGALLTLFLVEIFLGTVNIFMYDFTHMLIWTILFLLSEKDTLFIKKKEE
jgi:hypothetical protein